MGEPADHSERKFPRLRRLAPLCAALACACGNLSDQRPRGDGGPSDAGGIGAQCSTDNECASGRFCTGHVCTGCNTDADCRTGYVCSGHDCAQVCASAKDCATGEACLNGVCGACVSSADCGDPSLVCLGGSCLHCRSGADCPAGLACLSAGCGACTADGNCDPGSLCIGGTCKAGTCRDNSGCPATQRCDPQTLSCTTCTLDAQCSSGRICVSGVCETGDCHTTADCANGKACIGNACSACTAGSQCVRGSASFVCDTGACVAGNCVSGADCTGANAGDACLGHVCTACSNSADCGYPSSGQVCASGKCAGGDCAADVACAAGKICSGANLCGSCLQNSDCNASGVVCVSGACVSGQCSSNADCGGEICNGSRSCVACASAADCATAGLAGHVCDTGKCQPGNCTAATVQTDCQTSGSYDGRACVGNQCVHCGADSQCPAGDECYGATGATLCQPGNCHGNADCAGQICGASHFCIPCGTPGTQGGCDPGALCDDTHKCAPGATCVDSSACSGGKVCVIPGYACGLCQNDYSASPATAQCTAATPLCVSGQCVTGNCHASSDCTPGLGGSTLLLPYCDPSTHTCMACTASSECPGGYVCSASSAGVCVKGDCSFDVSCASFGPSWSCVSNACAQNEPTQLDGGMGSDAGEASAQGGSQPSVLSGALGLYYSYGESNNTGQHQVALDAADVSHVRWQTAEAVNGQNPFAGVVVPAPGFAGGELFLSGSANNNGITYAHDGQTGEVKWTVPTVSQAAVGIAGSGASGRLTMATGWYNPAGPYRLLLADADGTNQRAVNMPCGLQTSPAFGKYLVYFFCYTSLSAVDPVQNKVVFSLPFPGGGTACNGTAPAIWRNGPSDTSETVYFAAGTNGCGNPYAEYWVNVTDVVAQSGGALSPAGLSKGPTVNAATTAYAGTMLDTNDLGGGQAPRVVFAHSGGGVPADVSITDGAGVLLAAQVPTPFVSGMVSLAADGSLVGIGGTNGSLLTGIRITPNAGTPTAATVTTLWTLPLAPSGTWQTFAYPTAVGTPGPALGNLLVWAQPGGFTTPELLELAPGASAASFLPPQPPAAPPSWPWFGGDPGAHRSVANFDCASDSDCGTATESCILNRCIGTCRLGGAACPNQQGCVIGQCEACVADASCPAGQKCSSGVCYASGTCSINADCGASQLCIHAACVAATQPLSSTQWSSGTGAFTVGTDGSLYSLLVSSGMNVQAWDTTTLDGPALAPLASWPVMNIALGNYGPPLPTIMRLGANTYDTLFLHGGGDVLYAIPGVGASSAGGSNYVFHTTVDDASSTYASLLGPLAQGTSTVLDGTTARPTFFSYENGRIYAFDVQQAATGATGSGGAGNLHAVWSAATGCSASFCDNSGPSPVPLLVGSDGTVYHFRLNGEVQAWDPNGLHSMPPTGATYPGKMLWSFAAPTPWTDNVGMHPAIFKASGHDVLYFCTNVTSTVSMLSVTGAAAPAPSDYLQTTVPCTNISGIVVDTSGYALVAGGTMLTLMSPSGAVAAQIGFASLFNYGNNLVLGDDGIAYFGASGPFGEELTAVQITPSHGLSLLWQVPAPGNAPLDGYSFPILVPGSPAHLMADYPASSARDWTSFSLGTTHALMPSAWSMQGGDMQHRNSLKTQ